MCSSQPPLAYAEKPQDSLSAPLETKAVEEEDDDEEEQEGSANPQWLSFAVHVFPILSGELAIAGKSAAASASAPSKKGFFASLLG